MNGHNTYQMNLHLSPASILVAVNKGWQKKKKSIYLMRIHYEYSFAHYINDSIKSKAKYQHEILVIIVLRPNQI